MDGVFFFLIKYPWTSRFDNSAVYFKTFWQPWISDWCFISTQLNPIVFVILYPVPLLISNMANCLTMYLKHEVSGFRLPTKQGVPHILLTTYSTNRRRKFILFWTPRTVFVNLNKKNVYVLTVFIPFSNTWCIPLIVSQKPVLSFILSPSSW